MRLNKMQQYLSGRGWPFQYSEEYGLGSIDFEYRGISYHIWEFCQEPSPDKIGENAGQDSEDTVLYGAESNLKNGGKMDEYFGNYEQDMIDEIESWR